jgi:trehalose synthase
LLNTGTNAIKVRSISEYEPFVGRSYIDQLYLLAEKLFNRVIHNVNSTAVGGGVAEILSRMVPLLQGMGLDTRWSVIEGNEEFFSVTKKFHNALHGRPEEIKPEDFSIFWETSRLNLERLDLSGDFIFVHDPQPIALIKRKDKKEWWRRWVWRCHIDVSNPNPVVWQFLRGFIDDYDAAVFSAPSFAQVLPIRQFLIPPSIDPLSDKNRELPQPVIEAVLKKYGITQDKPIVTQISRFDYLKDPLGVIEAFELVRQHIDCQLVLAGGTAIDDPEAEKVLTEVRHRAEGNPDIHILLIPPGSDIDINALQRASTVIIQKSHREGFGLTVTEALWKAKPVVASAVGGIPLQITHKRGGLLCYTVEGAAFALRQLLSNPEYAQKLGESGREHVRENFLITRHIRDYLLLFLSLEHTQDVFYL